MYQLSMPYHGVIPSLPADCLLPEGPVAGGSEAGEGTLSGQPIKLSNPRLHEAVLSCLAGGVGELCGRYEHLHGRKQTLTIYTP